MENTNIPNSKVMVEMGPWSASVPSHRGTGYEIVLVGNKEDVKEKEPYLGSTFRNLFPARNFTFEYENSEDDLTRRVVFSSYALAREELDVFMAKLSEHGIYCPDPSPLFATKPETKIDAPELKGKANPDDLSHTR